MCPSGGKGDDVFMILAPDINIQTYLCTYLSNGAIFTIFSFYNIFNNLGPQTLESRRFFLPNILTQTAQVPEVLA